MARNSSILLRLTGDSADAQRAVAEVRSDLQRLGREQTQARIDIQTRGVEAQIQRVRDQLERLGRQAPSPKVDIATAAATAKLDKLELKLDRLNLKSVNVDVDIKRGKLETAEAAIGSVERGVQGLAGGLANVFSQIPIIGGGLESAFSGAFSAAESLGTAVAEVVTSGIKSLFSSFESVSSLAGPIGSVAGSVVSLGASLAGLAAVGGAVVIALNAILGAIIALGGALVALVASAAAAAAGLGALAVAFGAVLGPVILVGIALVQRFTAVLQARKAQEQAITSSVQQQKAAEDQRRQALDQVRQAHDQLSQAVVAGRQAMAQAAIDERNAEVGLQDSQLGLKSARLNVLEAKKQLRDLLTQSGVAGQSLNALVKKTTAVDFDPSKTGQVLGAVSGAGGQAKDPLAIARAILNVQQAQQGVRDAVNQTANAEDTLQKAQQKRVDFAQKGLRAYQPYNAALRQVSQAEDRLRQAQDKVSHAQANYEQKLKGLSDTQRGFLAQLDPFIAKLKQMADIVTRPIFAGLESAMQSLTTLFSDRGIQTAFQAIGQAIGNFFATLARELTSADWRAAFQQFAAAGARMIGTGGQGFIAMLRILREIARSALPALESMLRSVSAWLTRIAGQPGRIHHAVNTVVDQFRVWAKFAGAVANLVIALFRAAAPAGKSLASSMTHIVDRWTAWIKANPEKVRQFFRDAANETRKIVKWISEAVTWLKDHLPKAAAQAKAAFETIVPVAKTIWHWIKLATDLLSGNFADFAHNSPLGHQLGNPEGKKGKSFLDNFIHGLLGFATGGHVPGAGSGDTVPAMLTPGEFVVRKAVAAQLGLPLLQALNGGGPVEAASYVAGGAVHNHYYSVPGGGYPDARTAAALYERELRLAG